MILLNLLRHLLNRLANPPAEVFDRVRLADIPATVRRIHASEEPKP